jgi:hypothetical protein
MAAAACFQDFQKKVPTLTVAAVWPTILNRARCVNTLYQGVEKRMGSFPLSFELMLLWLTAWCLFLNTLLCRFTANRTDGRIFLFSGSPN